MKKSFMYLMTIMMAAMLSFSLVSCSSDDDEEEKKEASGNDPAKELVGDWKVVGGDKCADIGAVISFYEDGTCEWDPYIKWNLSDGNLYMTRRNNKVEKYLYEFKDGQLHLTFPDGNATEYTILEKIDLSSINIDSSYFVGSWSASGGHAYGTWTFKADGSCNFSYDKGGLSGTWKYNSATRILETSLQSWTWVIVSVTADEWSAKNGTSWKRVK